MSNGLRYLERISRALRRLATHADPFTQKRLLDLVSEYEVKIALLEPEPSAASRILRNDEA
jgi:hypothetical protein